mmetsp:Transcript_1059/g.2348  ORF Transcript_1059/g.2348 Transcript_1059/m.2348 type:complete len:315 (-) Transcript_1059:1395-2339(-)
MVYSKVHCRIHSKRSTVGAGTSNFFSMPRLFAVSFLVVNLCSFPSTSDGIGKAEAYNVIRVCRNKHCCKRANADVLQTMHNLVDKVDNDIIVEASGCLSNCDKGPNMEVATKSGTTILNGMTDVQMCAFQLGEISSSTPSFPPVPKILIAASKVIEQSQQFAANGQHQEQVRFLSSVIDKLESSPAVSPSTSANAHAHALRAQAHLELARGSEASGNDGPSSTIEAAVRDAQRVVQDLSDVATPASLSMAYRTWTDAELFLTEEREQQEQHEKELSRKKDFSKVVAVLTEWYRAQPIYRTKLQGEIQGLLLNTM